MSVERRVLSKQYKRFNELHPVTSNVEILVLKQENTFNEDKLVTPIRVERRGFL